MGQKIGTETATVSGAEMPPHQHVFNAENLDALNFGPNQALLAVPSQTNLYGAGTPPDTMDSSAIGNSSGGASHPNVMPFQCVNFLIALVGIYPSRN
jgi:microcystin-dependent protein